MFGWHFLRIDGTAHQITGLALGFLLGFRVDFSAARFQVGGFTSLHCPFRHVYGATRLLDVRVAKMKTSVIFLHIVQYSLICAISLAIYDWLILSMIGSCLGAVHT